jgi:hypothetical protein
MKFLSTLVALQIFCLAALADSPTGFAEVPFGTSLNSAEKTISAREGVKKGNATADQLTFSGGTFSGQPVSEWTLIFAGDKFASGSVIIDKVKKPVYDDLKAQLTKKYGKPDSEKGHHSFECLWEFRSDGRRSIKLEYGYMGKVTLTYSHGTLLKTTPPAKKSEKSDV